MEDFVGATLGFTISLAILIYFIILVYFIRMLYVIVRQESDWLPRRHYPNDIDLVWYLRDVDQDQINKARKKDWETRLKFMEDRNNG